MKKYMIAAAALLLFAGITNAQVAQKQPSKATEVKEASTTKNLPASIKPATSTATVSPTAKKTSTSNTTIKRKHHHKKTKTATDNRQQIAVGGFPVRFKAAPRGAVFFVSTERKIS